MATITNMLWESMGALCTSWGKNWKKKKKNIIVDGNTPLSYMEDVVLG